MGKDKTGGEEMRKIALMVCFVVIAGGFVYAQGKNGVTQTANEEYKKPEQVTQTAKSVILDKEKKRNRVGIAGKDDIREIYFEDRKGNKIKSIKLGQISLGKRKLKSENGAVEEANVIENVTGDVFKDGSGAVIAKHKLSYVPEEDNVLEIECLDDVGESKWTKEIGVNKAVGVSEGHKIKATGNGNIVFMSYDNDETPTNKEIRVYNSIGKEILCYPKDDADRNDKTIRRYKISENGRYLGIEYIGRKDSVIFFDLENGGSWDADEKWAIDSISDSGIIDLYFKSKTKRVDLNEKKVR